MAINGTAISVDITNTKLTIKTSTKWFNFDIESPVQFTLPVGIVDMMNKQLSNELVQINAKLAELQSKLNLLNFLTPSTSSPGTDLKNQEAAQ